MQATSLSSSSGESLTNKLKEISETLRSLGYTLEEKQPHISGERFLMMREKLVLVAKNFSDGKRFIIKISDHASGQAEIEHEKKVRDLLESLEFANDTVSFPKELYFDRNGQYLIWITEFIEQEKVFVVHAVEEQFFMILRAFESQETFHATTFEHLEKIKKIFPILYAQEYFREFKKFQNTFDSFYKNSEITGLLKNSFELLSKNKILIDTYCNYLTHTDFVPHNFRIREGEIHMLDLSAVQFGNKYEGWARFLNYMVIHNPALEQLLKDHVRKNRGEKEYLDLRLMRIYKIGFLLKFYAEALRKTEGDLRELTEDRIKLWYEILKRTLDDSRIENKLIALYKEKRDRLRSAEEKERQREFAVA